MEMPRPRGWTKAEVSARDRCVERLVSEGVPSGRSAEERSKPSRSRAYAICTAAVQQRRQRQRGEE
jgi:hypothetical protein